MCASMCSATCGQRWTPVSSSESLKGRQGDEARRASALIGMALSQVFDGMRRGGDVVDIKKLLDSARSAADLDKCAMEPEFRALLKAKA